MDKSKMKILVACEYSGIVRDAFIRKGHDAISCDLLPTESPGPHYQGDVLDILYDDWDMIIAFPPCTYTSNAGNSWLFKGGKLNKDRYEKGLLGKKFFMLFYDHPCNKKCIENPRPNKIFKFPRSTTSFEPYEHGHPYTKKTLLWLSGLSPLMPSDIVEPIGPWVVSGSVAKSQKWTGNQKRPRSGKDRAMFWDGVAKSMAEQWG